MIRSARLCYCRVRPPSSSSAGALLRNTVPRHSPCSIPTLAPFSSLPSASASTDPLHPTASTRQPEEYDKILTTTKRLLQHEGPFSTTMWNEGETALKWWTTTRASSNTCAPEKDDCGLAYSCQLLERLLQERTFFTRRMEQLQGAMDASALVDQCYSLDSTGLLRSIVVAHLDNNNSNNTRSDLVHWVEDVSNRFDLEPCDHVISLLQLNNNRPQKAANKVVQAEESIKETIVSKRSGSEEKHQIHPKRVPTDNDRLVGGVLLNFVREWTAAGLDLQHGQQWVDKFMVLEENEKQPRQAYAIILKAWNQAAQTKPSIAAKYADKALYEMITSFLEEEDNNNNTYYKPTKDCFASVIEAHTLCGDAEETDRVLQDMMILYKRTGDAEFCPDRNCFLSVFYSYFNDNNNSDMVTKADHVLRQMLDLAESTNDDSLIPPMSVFEHLLALWAKSREKDAGERVEVVMLRMQHLHDQGRLNDASKPSLQSFELLMKSWALSHQDKAAVRVEAIRSFVLKNFGKPGDVWDEPIPPTFGYLSLIQAWSRWNADKPQLAMEKTEHYFHELEAYFDSEHVSAGDIMQAYKARINAFGNIRHARKRAEKAQAALEELEQLQRTKVVKCEIDVTIYGAVANFWAKAGNVEMVQKIMNSNPEERLDTVVYNCLLQAHARSKDPKAGEKAQEILAQMEEEAKQNDAVRPNIRTHAIVMTCLSNSHDPAVAAKAETHLEHLKELYVMTGDERCRPNTQIYTAAMRALSRIGKPESVDKAQALLNEMNDLADQGDEHVRADKVTYGVLLQALSSADVPDKVERATEILRIMQKNGAKPDVFMEKQVRKISASQQQQS